MSFRIKENCFHGFENSVVIFLHSLVLELLSDKTDIDVMMLFKFDFNHAVLNLASMKFSFDLNLFFFFIKGLCFVQVKCQKRLPKKPEKISVSRVSIDQEFLLIDQTGIENRLIQAETS